MLLPNSAKSRREFLRSIGTGSLSIGLLSPGLLAGKKLIVRSASPLNAEPALEKLVESWVTPVESFYIRSHAATPRLDQAPFRLSVDGLVDRPLRLSVDELVERFPIVGEQATLTCAGNRRNEFSGKKIGGVQWGGGAIGNANWSGVSLAAVLRHAGLQPGAKHIWFEGADEIIDKSEKYPFGGSIPLEKALAGNERTPGTLLATRMNDKPLPPEHGYPLRGIVPGYIGARSVKWLRKIVVSDRPSPNHYLAQAYKLIAEETPAALEAAPPLYEFAINSVICLPAPQTPVKTGKLTVQGYALPSGAAGRTVTKLELSTDGGQTWTEAKVISPVKDFCWILWSAEVNVTARTDRLIVRATDSSGETQPREMAWNFKGYQYNAWHQVHLKPA
jgi:sulfite oxidase